MHNPPTPAPELTPALLDKVRSESVLSTHNVLAAFEVARSSPEFRKFVLALESHTQTTGPTNGNEEKRADV